MLDTINAAILAVTSPIDFSAMTVNFEDTIGIMMEDPNAVLPYASVMNEKPIIENATSFGSVRVSYPVAVTIYFKLTEAHKSIEREKQVKLYEAAARQIPFNIGQAHIAGTTSCEINETEITQSTSSNSRSEFCNTTINFILAFDEGAT